nr:Hypothetical protein [Pseudomonas aeruginosa]
MADSPVNRMSFSWHDIFTLMKQTRNLSEKGLCCKNREA